MQNQILTVNKNLVGRLSCVHAHVSSDSYSGLILQWDRGFKYQERDEMIDIKCKYKYKY